MAIAPQQPQRITVTVEMPDGSTEEYVYERPEGGVYEFQSGEPTAELVRVSDEHVRVKVSRRDRWTITVDHVDYLTFEEANRAGFTRGTPVSW